METKTRYSSSISAETFMLNLEKLQEGDNEEWKKLMQLLDYKMHAFAFRFTKDKVLIDDVIADTISDLYINRYMFMTMAHMLGHLYEFLRYRLLSLIKRYRKMVIDDGLMFHIASYLSEPDKEPITLQEEEDLEERKNEMLKIIRDHSPKLPPLYRKLVDLYLKVENMYDLKEGLKQFGKVSQNNKQDIRRSFKMIRSIINSNSVKNEDELLVQYEKILESLSPHQIEVLVTVRKHKFDNDSILEEMHMQQHQLTGALRRIGWKFREVTDDPRLTATEDNKRIAKYLNFFAGTHSDRVEELFDRMLVASKVPLRKEGKADFRQRPPTKVTPEFIQRATQLKREGKTWGAVAQIMGTTHKTLQKHINLFPDDIKKTSGVNVGNTRLRSKEVKNILKMKEEGRTIGYIAEQLGVDRTTISRAINGKTQVVKRAS